MTRLRRVIVIVGAAAFVAAAVWALWPPSERPYFDMVASLRAAGEAVDFEGLIASDVPSPGDDGGEEFLAAHQWSFTHVPTARWDEVVGPNNVHSEPDWADTSTPEQMEELAAFVAEIEPCLALVRRAAAKERIRFRRDPRDAFGFPDPGATTRLQWMLGVLMTAAVGARQEAARIDALACIAAIGSRAECVIMSDHMTGGAFAISVATETRRRLEARRLDAAAARARLDPLLRERWLDRTPALGRCERASCIQAYRTLLDGTFPYPRRTFGDRMKQLVTTGGVTLAKLDRGMPEKVVAYCEPLSAAIRTRPGRYADYRRALSSALSARPDPSFPNVYFIETTAERFCRVDAVIRLTRIALAAAEHRATHGDFPASLDELKPMFPDGVPLDPFTDAPFVYEKTPTGVRIASAGRLPEDPPLDEATLRERVLVWELKR